MRVSTPEQSLDLQREALEAAGCERIYEDKATSKDKEREGFSRLMDALRMEDVLVVWKLDRLARSTKQLLEVMERLDHLGVDLQVITQNIDTTTSAGRMMFGIFDVTAEFERDLIRERTLAGLAAARVRGRLGGRPRKRTKQKLRSAQALIKAGELSTNEITQELGLSRSTLYGYINGLQLYQRRGNPYQCRQRTPQEVKKLCVRVNSFLNKFQMFKLGLVPDVREA